MNMSAEILGGREVAEAIKLKIAEEVRNLPFKPCLAVVRVGEDAASAVYVGNKVKTCNELGIKSEHLHLSAETTQTELSDIVNRLNADENVDGILVQLPLPKQIDEKCVLDTVSAEKDVDGFNPISVGKLATGQNSLVPCTPAGVIEILRHYKIDMSGKHAVVVGRSNIVGKPLAMLLLQNDATVTICHSRTKNLSEITKQADILIAAIGRAGFIKAEHIKNGAVVIDVGINKVSDTEFAKELFDESELEKRLATIEKRGFTLVGDVNPKDALKIAGKFTPVPGGVGLLTIAMLMQNTIQAAKMRREN
jgi:methylenetetrahydrofolate dehydrogenase (NADP+) / methenyltetrahydrofolate cyclohydrolase